MTDGSNGMDRIGETEPAETTAKSTADSALDRLPPQLRRMASRWPGRIVARSAAGAVRVDIFDRSMTIAAQFFTSVLPILILFASWRDAGETRRIADAVNMPAESRSVLDDAVQGGGSAAFGIAGKLIVLVSATSLSRALTRAFAAVWSLPRPRSSLGPRGDGCLPSSRWRCPWSSLAC